MFDLSEKKQNVLLADGNLLVMGGPGSGKTTIALLKAKYIINQNILKKEQKILFLSFARATISRVEQHAKNVLKECDTSALEITTYHSFIWNILKGHSKLLTPHKIRLLPPHEASTRLSGVTNGAEREAEKDRLFMDEGLLHFDIFAKNCAELLSRSKALSRIISSAYPIIILDEFQDTNEDEWALISHLGTNSTLIALADPEQRIYDFRGADPARIGQFISAYSPTTFDFGTENNRSNGTDIVEFGNDLLAGRNKGKEYKNVKVVPYTPRKENGQLLSIKTHILNRLKQVGADSDWSLAVLVPSNSLMITISAFLSKRHNLAGGKVIPAIPHEVSVEPAGPAIAATVIAKLLELSSRGECNLEDFVMGLCEHILGRRGDRVDKPIPKTDQDLVKALTDYVSIGDLQNVIRGKARQLIINECKQLVVACDALKLTGDVAADWLQVRESLVDCTSGCLKKLYEDAMFIKLLHKGSILNNSLGQIWRANGNYSGAMEAVRNALTQEHFATSAKTWRGVNVMTIHKAKGKEFDEVIVYEGSFGGQRLVFKNDLDRAKLSLRVAVTRAKNHVFILTPEKEPCSLL